MKIRTRRAVPSDLDRAATVLGAAFSDYAWTRWTVDPRDHQSRITSLQRLTLEHVGLALGSVWVTTVDDTIQSVAVWTDSADANASAPNPTIEQLTAGLEGSRRQASLAAERQLADWRPTQRHLYLGAVGTVPAARPRSCDADTVAHPVDGRQRTRPGIPRNVSGVEHRLLRNPPIRGGRSSSTR